MPRTSTLRLRREMAVLRIDRDPVKPKIDNGIAASIRKWDRLMAMGGCLTGKVRSMPLMPMTDHAAADETAFIKANAAGLTRKIIRPANALTIWHYGNMTEALSAPFHPIGRNKRIVLDAEGGKPTLHTRDEIVATRTLRLTNRVR